VSRTKRRQKQRRRGDVTGRVVERQQLIPTEHVDLRVQGALGETVITEHWPIDIPIDEYRPTVRLEDGTTGWCMSPVRMDDCLRPSIATVLQVPVEQVPDPQLDERLARGEAPEQINRAGWDRLEGWLAGRGLRLAVHHDELPVARDRWIGVVRGQAPVGDELPFMDHCLVMSRRRVLLNPMVSIPPPSGMRAPVYALEHVGYGITFEKREESNDG
jgi:hypothetical protein